MWDNHVLPHFCPGLFIVVPFGRFDKGPLRSTAHVWSTVLMCVSSFFSPLCWRVPSWPSPLVSGLPPICAPVGGGNQTGGTTLCVWASCGMNAEVMILNKRHRTIQEGQTVISHILPDELDVLVHGVYVSSERLGTIIRFMLSSQLHPTSS